MRIHYLLTWRSDRFSCAWRRIPCRYGCRGALCRYGAYRREAHPACMVWVGAAVALCLTMRDRRRSFWRGYPTADNIFYHLCPQPLLMPFIGLATIATIIASQAIITGAFSMTRQAIQLGWCPRFQHHANLGGRLWADLCRRRQLVAHDCDASALRLALAAPTASPLPMASPFR